MAHFVKTKPRLPLRERGAFADQLKNYILAPTKCELARPKLLLPETSALPLPDCAGRGHFRSLQVSPIHRNSARSLKRCDRVARMSWPRGLGDFTVT